MAHWTRKRPRLMVGQWAISAGVLFSNALSGRTAIKILCRRHGRKFVTPQ